MRTRGNELIMRYQPSVVSTGFSWLNVENKAIYGACVCMWQQLYWVFVFFRLSGQPLRFRSALCFEANQLLRCWCAKQRKKAGVRGPSGNEWFWWGNRYWELLTEVSP